MMGIKRAARAVAQLHAENGGATFSLHDGNRAGHPLFAVSLFPERTRRFPGSRLPIAMVERYIQRNLDLLQDRRVCVGTWFDEDQDVTFVDVSLTLVDQGEAEEIARRYNQIAIYDLRAGRMTPTGGTGEEIRDLPAEAERLPRD